jgi:uncharacterized protein (TIGR02996 family)
MKELLQAVLERPDDDAPRLVYADALMAEGDPRGEFIQVQCALKARRGDTSALMTRERALLSAHKAQWEAPFEGVGLVWSRGFPETVIGQGKALVKLLPACVEELPIRSVTVSSTDLDSFVALTKLPALRRVAELEISGSDRYDDWTIGDVGAEALARAPMDALRKLTLGPNRIGTEGSLHLSMALWLMKLTKFAYGGNVLDANIVGSLTSVRELSIQGNSVPCTSLNDGIERLRLSDCRLIGALPKLPHLHTLILDQSRVGDEGALELVRGPFPKLEVLRLDHNGIGDLGAAALSATQLPLVELNLSNNYIKTTGATALAESTSLTKLVRLDLQDNQLGSGGVTALVNGKGLPALRELGVSRNGIYTGETEQWTDWNGAVVGEGPVSESHAQLKAGFASKPMLKIL